MRFRNIFLLAALIQSFLTGPWLAQAATKPLMVHYMPWFVSQPYSGAWKWHWTMDHFNPGTTNANGSQQIASWYYPLIGPYDSADPAVLEYHVLLMKLAGIDGVIVDWYGPDNFEDYAVNNQRTLALFNVTRKAHLKFCLCYEDRTVQLEVIRNYTSQRGALAQAQKAMLYAQTHFFNDPSFLRLDNAPVLLNFGPQYFTNSSDWAAIFSVLHATNSPLFFTEDNRLAAGAGAFNWPPMWMSGGGTNLLSPAQLQKYLDNFEQAAGAWPSFISSAFPRFHDIYAEAGSGASYGCLPDGGGRTLTDTLTRALTNNSAVAQIVTWNDFGEGTVVEPTTQYGYRDLEIIQKLRRQFLDSSFPYHTNDLALAFRFYQCRRQAAKNPAASEELDRVFASIISGDLSFANSRLAGLESNRATAFKLVRDNSELQ